MLVSTSSPAGWATIDFSDPLNPVGPSNIYLFENTTIEPYAAIVYSSKFNTPLGAQYVIYGVIQTSDATITASNRLIALSPLLCGLSSQCPPGFACGSNCTCVPAPPNCIGTAPPGAVCIGNVWTIQGPLVISPNASVTIRGPTSVNGSVQLSPGSTIIFTSTGSINVTGCVSIDGTAIVSVPPSSSGLTGNVTLLAFGGGYCDAQKNEFASTNVSSSAAAECETLKSDFSYGQRSISLLYTYNFQSCEPNQASTVALTAGAIAGIVIAAVAGLAIVIAATSFVVIRRRVSPFSDKPTVTGDTLVE